MNTKINRHFDIIIVGAGAAGLSLLYRLLNSSLKNSKILLLDKNPKNQNDRTWCFWEKKEGLFEEIVFKKWAKAVGERTKGELKVQVFHSAQLGVEEDIIEQIRAGANIGQNTDSARMGNYVPEIAVMNGPYFVSDYNDVFKLGDLPVVKGWKAKLEKEFGIKILSFYWVQGFRSMVTNKPIRKPEDLNGLRIRTPGAPIWQESIRALGAEPVAMAFGDVPSRDFVRSAITETLRANGMRDDDMAILEFNSKHRIWQSLFDHAFHLNRFFFCHVLFKGLF